MSAAVMRRIANQKSTAWSSKKNGERERLTRELSEGVSASIFIGSPWRTSPRGPEGNAHSAATSVAIKRSRLGSLFILEKIWSRQGGSKCETFAFEPGFATALPTAGGPSLSSSGVFQLRLRRSSLEISAATNLPTRKAASVSAIE
jgi:hypothetical protein